MELKTMGCERKVLLIWVFDLLSCRGGSLTFFAASEGGAAYQQQVFCLFIVNKFNYFIFLFLEHMLSLLCTISSYNWFNIRIRFENRRYFQKLFSKDENINALWECNYRNVHPVINYYQALNTTLRTLLPKIPLNLIKFPIFYFLSWGFRSFAVQQ